MNGYGRRDYVKHCGLVGAGLPLAGCLESDDESTPEQPGNGNATVGNRVDDEQPNTPTYGRRGETIEDFESLAAWETMDEYGEFEPETEDVASGSQAIRLRATADEPYVGVRRRFEESLDLSGTNLSVAFKVDRPPSHQLEVRLLAPDRANTLRLNRTQHGPTDHWMRLDLGAVGEIGDPDLREVTELRLIGRKGDDDVAIEYLIDDVRTVDAPDRGKVIFTFDDNHESQYAAFETMKRYDFAGVMGVIHGSVGDGDRLDLEQLRELRAAGWDIVSHPHPPEQWGLPLSKFDEGAQREILADSIEWLETHGFEDSAGYYLAPNHTRDATNLELLREYHESSASFGGGNVGVPITDPHTIGRIPGDDPDEVMRFIDLAATYGQVCCPLWHVVGTTYDDHEVSEAEFEAILEHVDEADVDVITQSELLDEY